MITFVEVLSHIILTGR